VADPSLATYGTLPRNFLRGPGFVNFGMAFSKTTPLVGERTKLEFRAEFFNIFNHSNFQTSNTNINSGQFGQVLSYVRSTHHPARAATLVLVSPAQLSEPPRVKMTLGGFACAAEAAIFARYTTSMGL
jgi:hypothetical protein